MLELKSQQKNHWAHVSVSPQPWSGAKGLKRWLKYYNVQKRPLTPGGGCTIYKNISWGQFLKKFKEISKKNFIYWFIYTLTFSCITDFKEVSLPPCVPVHALIFTFFSCILTVLCALETYFLIHPVYWKWRFSL